MIVLRKEDQRAIGLAARAAVLEQAAEPLPEDLQARASEGARRKNAAVKALIEESKKQSGACQCSPVDVLAGLQTAKVIIQTVWDLLKSFGVIGANGAALP